MPVLDGILIIGSPFSFSSILILVQRAYVNNFMGWGIRKKIEKQAIETKARIKKWEQELGMSSDHTDWSWMDFDPLNPTGKKQIPHPELVTYTRQSFISDYSSNLHPGMTAALVGLRNNNGMFTSSPPPAPLPPAGRTGAWGATGPMGPTGPTPISGGVYSVRSNCVCGNSYARGRHSDNQCILFAPNKELNVSTHSSRPGF